VPRPRLNVPAPQLSAGQASYVLDCLIADRRISASEVSRYVSDMHREISDLESRFWFSYRPYESKNVAREWFLGPVLTWMHSQHDRVGGITQSGSAGDLLLAGITTFVGLRPGMHVWLGADWDVTHSTGTQFMPVRHHISFGITQQFRFHL